MRIFWVSKKGGKKKKSRSYRHRLLLNFSKLWALVECSLQIKNIWVKRPAQTLKYRIPNKLDKIYWTIVIRTMICMEKLTSMCEKTKKKLITLQLLNFREFKIKITKILKKKQIQKQYTNPIFRQWITQLL
jgi:hypothetical protein